MSANEPQLTEEQLRAAYEAEIKKIRVEDILLENVATLINLGMRRTGLVPGTESERDPAQVRTAIEAVKALLPTLEAATPEQLQPIRQALSQLQMAYVQIAAGQPSAEPTAAAGEPEANPEAAAEPSPEASGEQRGPGPAESSGRLWVPGQ